MSENPGGSCEPCKKKKCKCDRRLPICGQCEGTSQSCKYSEGNKRGIPTGYLGTLEQRLTETEIALYNALSELQKLRGDDSSAENSGIAMPSTSLTVRDTNINKTARMAEWKDFPLRTSTDTARWHEFFSKGEKTTPIDRDTSAEAPPSDPGHPVSARSLSQNDALRYQSQQASIFGVQGTMISSSPPRTVFDEGVELLTANSSTAQSTGIPSEHIAVPHPGSLSGASNFVPSAQIVDFIEQNTNYNGTAVDGERRGLWARPDGLGPEFTARNMSQSQQLAAAFRNKYF